MSPRILVYPADTSRCGRRILWPAETLIAQGAEIVIGDRHKPDDPIWNESADVVVLQRPMLRRYLESYFDDDGQWVDGNAIERLQADGIKVVVDIDDDFRALNRKNDVWRRVHPSQSPNCNWQHLSTACRLADLVTVTTPALAKRYGSHGRCVIIPNHIPASYLRVEKPVNDTPLAGWTGAVATHPDDLQVTRGAVSRAVQQTGAGFHVVGPPDGVQSLLGLSQPITASGWVDLDTYPIEMARIDVGIVPLEMSGFNQAKSWLKMMEFAALGVACVGSPTDPNVEFATKYGLPLAAKPKDWERWLRRLIVDEQFRAELAGEARAAMWGETIEGNAHLWMEAWEYAYAGGRKQVMV